VQHPSLAIAATIATEETRVRGTIHLSIADAGYAALSVKPSPALGCGTWKRWTVPSPRSHACWFWMSPLSSGFCFL
jgi:hypothetical protein